MVMRCQISWIIKVDRLNKLVKRRIELNKVSLTMGNCIRIISCPKWTISWTMIKPTSVTIWPKTRWMEWETTQSWVEQLLRKRIKIVPSPKTMSLASYRTLRLEGFEHRAWASPIRTKTQLASSVITPISRHHKVSISNALTLSQLLCTKIWTTIA